MSQIMYNYPAMLALAAEMNGYSGALHAVGADVASELAALSAGWQGDTGMSYQAWQAQWNASLEELVRAYRAMSSTHEMNTMSMSARDAAQGAKWGAA
jgi:WXG100 family type VII secretion target